MSRLVLVYILFYTQNPYFPTQYPFLRSTRKHHPALVTGKNNHGLHWRDISEHKRCRSTLTSLILCPFRQNSQAFKWGGLNTVGLNNDLSLRSPDHRSLERDHPGRIVSQTIQSPFKQYQQLVVFTERTEILCQCHMPTFAPNSTPPLGLSRPKLRKLRTWKKTSPMNWNNYQWSKTTTSDPDWSNEPSRYTGECLSGPSKRNASLYFLFGTIILAELWLLLT